MANNPIVAFFKTVIGTEEARTPSPMGRWLAGVLREVEAGELTVEYTVREEMTNPAGTLHGGAVSAILDDIIGAAVYSLCLPTLYVSVNLTVDFLGPARVGDVIRAKTKIVRAGKTIVNAEGWLTHADGRLIARATTNLLSTGQPNPFGGEQV